jgi:hypothetical protein
VMAAHRVMMNSTTLRTTYLTARSFRRTGYQGRLRP